MMTVAERLLLCLLAKRELKRMLTGGIDFTGKRTELEQAIKDVERGAEEERCKKDKSS